MRVWRLTDTGENAELAACHTLHTCGRWNSEGKSVIYTSQSLSLAALEVLAHLPSDAPSADWLSICLDVPEFSQSRLRDLHPQWPDCLDWCREQGNHWLEANATLILIVPSAIISQEFNVLVNPCHALAAWIRVLDVQPFAFDPRIVPSNKKAA